MRVSVATPKDYQPAKEILDFAQPTGRFEWTDDPMKAAEGADVVYTDVWASMGQEEEAAQRQKDFAGFQVNQTLMERTNPGCMVLHCLPAHRGEEVTGDVMEAHANEIFDEAENRLHAQKAVMVKVIGK